MCPMNKSGSPKESFKSWQYLPIHPPETHKCGVVHTQSYALLTCLRGGSYTVFVYRRNGLMFVNMG